MRSGSYSAREEAGVLANAIALAHGTSLATILAWAIALATGFVLTTIAGFALIPAGDDAGWVITGIWYLVAAWAIGTTSRLAAWDEVGDRAALQALRVLLAFPWMAAGAAVFVAGSGGALPVVVAVPVFGVVALVVVQAMVHHALGMRGLAASTVQELLTVTPRTSAGLAILGMLLAARWMTATGGASGIELIAYLAFLQAVTFSQVDAVVGVPGGAVRTSLGRRAGASTALALAWPVDGGVAQLERAGVLDRSRQPRAGSKVTLQRLPRRGAVRASRWVDVPGGGELWVAARWIVTDGDVIGPAHGARVVVRGPAHEELVPHVVGTSLARYHLPAGTWEVEMLVSEEVAATAGQKLAATAGQELAVWWALVEPPATGTAAAA